MLEICLISLLRRLLIFIIIFKIVLGPMSGTYPLQHSKLNCTVSWTMIASGLPNLIRIVCWEKIISLLRSHLIIKKNCQNVWPTAFATVKHDLEHAVDYHSK